MPRSLAVPPGRAGRTWLLGRIASARRGADLLDRKRQLLELELKELRARREAATSDWEEACAATAVWALRADAIGGRDDVSLAAVGVEGQASVAVTWRNTMGVVHPDEPTCTVPALPPFAAAAGNAAIAPAAAAAGRALRTGARLAALSTACDLLGEELRSTKRRLRAIVHRRLPMLMGALAALELRLEELERQDRVVARWASGNAASSVASAGRS